MLKVVHDLRTQCPWDRKQTHQTLAKYLLEEAYEAVDAIHSKNKTALKEELGDVLLQVALHSEIAAEKNKFNFEDVAEYISEKMIRRHPHIYAKEKVLDYKSHMKNWTALKQKEKPKRKLLEGTPKGLPGLQLSQRYGEIASSVGFDWNNEKQVMKKVREELQELQKAIAQKSKEDTEEELGDLLFTLTSLARHCHVDAEASIRKAAEKFRRRIETVEKIKKKQKKTLGECTPQELEAAWKKVKKSS
ncbi:MAG: nucleoside triphosphate pyrophosphohydrolase [Deltaproteobacteria bacterium]